MDSDHIPYCLLDCTFMQKMCQLHLPQPVSYTHLILIPEIPYNVDEVLNTIRKRKKQGKKFTIIAMAEGAISDEDAGKTKMVNADNELIRQSESLGISLGRKV